MKTLTLNFLGKDSVPYKNSIEIPDEIADALASLMEGKSSSDLLFPEANECSVNEFLSECIPDCTAKLFRTAYGSMLLSKELQSHPITKTMSLAQKKAVYNNAALEVSKKLNHQKNISKNYEAQTEKMDERISLAKEKEKATEEKVKEQLKKIKHDVEIAKKCFTGERLSEKLQALKEKKEKCKTRLERAKERIEKLSIDKQFKANTKNIAIGTAKSAYSDPEVAASWLADTGIDPSFIYSKSLREKYSWAFENPNPEYWKTYPLGNPKK